MTDRLSRLARSWDEAAGGYETYFVPRFAPWVQAAVDAVRDLPDGPVVVPCCGTFPELDLLAPRFPDRRIIGVDLSAGMVRLARRRADGQSLVEVVQGDASSLDPAWSPAAVVSVFGLQQLPDPVTALRSWYDVLRQNGRLCVVYWPEAIEETGPFELLDTVIGAERDRSWEDALLPALDHAEIERDELISFPMTHPGAAAYFDAANHAGPLRALALARGDDYIAELRERYVAAAPAGEWTHRPRARLIAVRKRPSRAGAARPTS
jgi:SAM-dependent methyltransferase